MLWSWCCAGNPALEQLVSMGFDREQSKNALEAADVGAKDAGYPQESRTDG